MMELSKQLCEVEKMLGHEPQVSKVEQKEDSPQQTKGIWSSVKDIFKGLFGG